MRTRLCKLLYRSRMDGCASLRRLEFSAFAAWWGWSQRREMLDFSLDEREIPALEAKPIYWEEFGKQGDLVSLECEGILGDFVLLRKAVGRS